MEDLFKQYPKYTKEIEEARRAGIDDDIIAETINERVSEARSLGHTDEEINSALQGGPEMPVATKRPEFTFKSIGRLFQTKPGDPWTKEWKARIKEQAAREGVSESVIKEREGIGRLTSFVRGGVGGAALENIPQDYSGINTDIDTGMYNLGKAIAITAPASAAFKVAGMAGKIPLLMKEAIAGGLMGAAEKPEEGGSRVSQGIQGAIAWPVIGGAMRLVGRAPLAAVAGVQQKSARAAVEKLFGMGKKPVASMPIIEGELAKETAIPGQKLLPAPTTIYVTPEGVNVPTSQAAKYFGKAPRAPLQPNTPQAILADEVRQGGGELLSVMRVKEGDIVLFMDPRTNTIQRMALGNVNRDSVRALLNPLMGNKAPVLTQGQLKPTFPEGGPKTPPPSGGGGLIKAEEVPEEVTAIQQIEEELQGTQAAKNLGFQKQGDIKKIVEDAGGIFIGADSEEVIAGKGPMIHFNDASGVHDSTMNLFAADVTPRAVSEKLASKRLEFERAAQAAAAKVAPPAQPSLKDILTPEKLAAVTRKGGRPTSRVRAQRLTDAEARVVASKYLIENEGKTATEAIQQVASMDILKARNVADKALTQFRLQEGFSTAKGGRPRELEEIAGKTKSRELTGLSPETLETEVIEKGLKSQYINLETLKEPPTPAITLGTLKTQLGSKGYDLSVTMDALGTRFRVTGPGGSTETFATLEEAAASTGNLPRKSVQPIEKKNFTLGSAEPQPSPFEKAVTGKQLDEQDKALLRQQKEFYDKAKDTLEGEIASAEVVEPARNPVLLKPGQRIGTVVGIETRDELVVLADQARSMGYEPMVIKAPGGYDLLYSAPGTDTKKFSELYYKMITQGPRSLKPTEMKYLNDMVSEMETGQGLGPPKDYEQMNRRRAWGFKHQDIPRTKMTEAEIQAGVRRKEELGFMKENPWLMARGFEPKEGSTLAVNLAKPTSPLVKSDREVLAQVTEIFARRAPTSKATATMMSRARDLRMGAEPTLQEVDRVRQLRSTLKTAAPTLDSFLAKFGEGGASGNAPFFGEKITRREFLKSGGRMVKGARELSKRATLPQKEAFTDIGGALWDATTRGADVHWAAEGAEPSSKQIQKILGPRVIKGTIDRIEQLSQAMDKPGANLDQLADQIDTLINKVDYKVARETLDTYKPTANELVDLLLEGGGLPDAGPRVVATLRKAILTGKYVKKDYPKAYGLYESFDIDSLLDRLKDMREMGYKWSPEGIMQKVPASGIFKDVEAAFEKGVDILSDTAEKLGKKELSRRQFLTFGLGKKKGQEAWITRPSGLLSWVDDEAQGVQNRDVNTFVKHVKDMADAFGQKGLNKVPENWIKVLTEVRYEPDNRGGIFKWPKNLAEELHHGIGWHEELYTGGNIVWGRTRDPGVLVHEVAHSGWYAEVPTREKAIFYQEYLRNPRRVHMAYGGPEWADSQATLGEYWEAGQRQDARNAVHQGASELFAMAVAEKAVLMGRGAARNITGEMSRVPYSSILYGKLSKEARAVIDKYVKIILLGLGGKYAATSAEGAGAVSSSQD